MFSELTLVDEIDHGGNIYTTEIGKCYIRASFSTEAEIWATEYNVYKGEK